VLTPSQRYGPRARFATIPSMIGDN